MRMIVLPPEPSCLISAGRDLSGTLLHFRASACQRSSRTVKASVRQILCRDPRQVPSMDTVRVRSQEKSGKRNLTHHILRRKGIAKPQQNGPSQEGCPNAPKYFPSTWSNFLCLACG